MKPQPCFGGASDQNPEGFPQISQKARVALTSRERSEQDVEPGDPYGVRVGRLGAAYRAGEVADATGCGDQFMAILCSHLATDPADMASALEHALVAAALQAARLGIQPVPRDEVFDHLARYRQQPR